MTPVDVNDLLPLYALGVLDTDDALVVERAVAADPDLAAALALHRDAMGELTDLVTPIQPSAEVAARLMSSIGAGRYENLSTRMATLFDVSVDRARELLGLIERSASWEVGLPGVALVHFDGGPAYTAADCGFIRIDAGAMFPPHTHVGEEVTLIISGRLRDADGRILEPGDELVRTAGSEHHLFADGDEPCIFAARAMNGIEIAGVRVVPPGR